ncbi:cytochrome P450 [Mycena pura]|uniref:Cytochrome P450 n=1 Tax=Mycena pura TaxID=153505 RepID=A0AAD7E418_9AGAR|nr:cytochrome P450 [Mycena pura]
MPHQTSSNFASSTNSNWLECTWLSLTTSFLSAKFSAVVFLFLSLYLAWVYEGCRRKLCRLPQNGRSNVLKSYVDSTVNAFCANDAVRRLARLYGDSLFTFGQLGMFAVMVKAKDNVRDYCNATEDALSMEAAAEDLLQLRHTVGNQFCDETYHIPAIRQHMNFHLRTKLPELLAEMHEAFRDELDHCVSTSGSEWVLIRISKKIPQIICRSNSRIFVGPELCRDPKYCELARNFTDSVITWGALIRILVPIFLRPLAGRIFRYFHRHRERMLEHCRPLIMERMADQQKLKGQQPAHEDMLTWLIQSEAPENGHSIESVAMRMLNINYVAMHTTTKAFTHAVYHLASKPHYIPILREEAETYLDIEDPTQWSTHSLSRCIKIDSFLKESVRLNGLGAMYMPRKIVRDFTFSDGSVVPAGHFMALAVIPIHEDPIAYGDKADEFDGLRFSNAIMKERSTVSSSDGGGAEGLEAGTESDSHWAHRLTGPSPNFVTFGGGRHLCPGRFLASLLMKSMLAYLLLRYDVRTEVEGVRPEDGWFGPTSSPASRANILPAGDIDFPCPRSLLHKRPFAAS